MHIPVLLSEILRVIAPQSDQLIIDATFGAGGYTRRFLESGAHVIAFDRDPAAQAGAKKLAQEFPKQFQFIQAPFSRMLELANISSPLKGERLGGGSNCTDHDPHPDPPPFRGRGRCRSAVFHASTAA